MIKYVGIMKPMVAGDAALYRLMQRRYTQLGIGGEVYPDTPARLRELLAFMPQMATTDLPAMAHLPYHLNLLDAAHFAEIIEYARVGAAAGMRGFTLHERRSYINRLDEFMGCVEKLSTQLASLKTPPEIFIEYISANSLDDYYWLMTHAVKFAHIFPCLDVGHIAVDYCRAELTRRLPQIDQNELSPTTPELPEIIAEITAAVAATLAPTLAYLKKFAALNLAKWHFHAHDAHPLSKLSPYPIRDHLAFLQLITIPCVCHERQVLSGLYGVRGAQALARTVAEIAQTAEVSLMLEIHAQPGRLPLCADADLFAHWRDLSNAEAMNYHLHLVAECLTIMRSVDEKVIP